MKSRKSRNCKKSRNFRKSRNCKKSRNFRKSRNCKKSRKCRKSRNFRKSRNCKKSRKSRKCRKSRKGGEEAQAIKNYFIEKSNSTDIKNLLIKFVNPFLNKFFGINNFNIEELNLSEIIKNTPDKIWSIIKKLLKQKLPPTSSDIGGSGTGGATSESQWRKATDAINNAIDGKNLADIKASVILADTLIDLAGNRIIKRDAENNAISSDSITLNRLLEKRREANNVITNMWYNNATTAAKVFFFIATFVIIIINANKYDSTSYTFDDTDKRLFSLFGDLSEFIADLQLAEDEEKLIENIYDDCVRLFKDMF